MESSAAGLAPVPDVAVKWTEAWSAYLGVSVTLTTLVTLVVLFRQTSCQMRQSHHIAEQTQLLTEQVQLTARTNREILYQNVSKEMQAISALFLQAPALRCYFYEGATPPPHDADLRVQVEIVSEMIVDFTAMTLNTFNLFSDDEKSGWTSYFEDIARNSPAIRRYWRAQREWYEPPVRAVLDPVVAAFRDDAPPDIAAAS